MLKLNEDKDDFLKDFADAYSNNTTKNLGELVWELANNSFGNGYRKGKDVAEQESSEYAAGENI